MVHGARSFDKFARSGTGFGFAVLFVGAASIRGRAGRPDVLVTPITCTSGMPVSGTLPWPRDGVGCGGLVMSAYYYYAWTHSAGHPKEISGTFYFNWFDIPST